MISIDERIILSALQKLIARTIAFDLSQQSAIMSKITWIITLHGSNSNRLLKHLIP